MFCAEVLDVNVTGRLELVGGFPAVAEIKNPPAGRAPDSSLNKRLIGEALFHKREGGFDRPAKRHVMAEAEAVFVANRTPGCEYMILHELQHRLLLRLALLGL